MRTQTKKKQNFLDDYYEKEGVRLDADKMAANSAMRSLAKLCLNSFWGKFGQRENLPQTEYFLGAEKFLEIFFDPGNIAKSVYFVSETVALMQYTKQEEFVEGSLSVNAVIAAAVTSQARLKLYSYLEKLQDRICYYDTDSVVYLTKPDDDYVVPIGNFLGEMTDELEKHGKGSYILEFVSGGPKNYGYKVMTPGENGDQTTECFKVKGVCLSAEAMVKLRFSEIKEAVCDYVRGAKREILVPQTTIKRTKNWIVLTVSNDKRYRVVYDKRVLCSDFETLPFGY